MNTNPEAAAINRNPAIEKLRRIMSVMNATKIILIHWGQDFNGF